MARLARATCRSRRTRAGTRKRSLEPQLAGWVVAQDLERDSSDAPFRPRPPARPTRETVLANGPLSLFAGVGVGAGAGKPTGLRWPPHRIRTRLRENSPDGTSKGYLLETPGRGQSQFPGRSPLSSPRGPPPRARAPAPENAGSPGGGGGQETGLPGLDGAGNAGFDLVSMIGAHCHESAADHASSPSCRLR